MVPIRTIVPNKVSFWARKGPQKMTKCVYTHTHRPTDGLVQAFIDWVTEQKEDTEMEKYMPKQFPRQPASNSQASILTSYNEVWIRDTVSPSPGTTMHSLFSLTSHLTGLLLTGSSG